MQKHVSSIVAAVTLSMLLIGTAFGVVLIARAAPGVSEVPEPPDSMAPLTIVAPAFIQDFNNDDAADTLLSTSVTSGATLPNAASSNAGAGLNGYSTTWIDTRDIITGPVTADETEDAIGVNYATDLVSITGPMPQVGPDRTTPVAAGVEQNFVLNDGDGTLVLTFESVNLSGLSDPGLSFYYWMAPMGYEDGEGLTVSISDGTTTVNVIEWGDTDLEQRNAPPTVWHLEVVDLADHLDGLNQSNIVLSFAFDSDGAEETLFLDEIMFGELVDSPETVITKSVTPGTVKVGDMLTYTITLENIGQLADEDVMLIDPLPTAVTWVDWVQRPSNAADYNPTDHEVTWTGSIDAGETLTFTFEVVNTIVGGTVPNTAQVIGTYFSGRDRATYTTEMNIFMPMIVKNAP